MIEYRGQVSEKREKWVTARVRPSVGCSSWPTTSNSLGDTDVTMVTQSHDSRGSQLAEHPSTPPLDARLSSPRSRWHVVSNYSAIHTGRQSGRRLTSTVADLVAQSTTPPLMDQPF